LARQPLFEGVEFMYPPVRGGSLGSTRHLGEVEPGDPVLRVDLDRVAVIANGLAAISETCSGVT